jgi:hypothetical protein
MFPGYTSIHDFANTSAVPLGLRFIAGFGDTGEYLQYPIAQVYFSSSSTKLYWINNSGVATEFHEYTEGVGLEPRAGLIPGYTFGNKAFVFTGDRGSATAIGLKFNIGDVTDPENGAIGLSRPNINTGDDTGAAATSTLGTAGGAVKGVVKYFVSYSGQDGNDEGALSLKFGEIDAEDGYDIDLSSLPTKDTNKRRLYRTFSDGDQPFYLATLNSSDTDYTDNIADADLGDLPLKMGDPPVKGIGYQDATWHYGRAYILDNIKRPRRIYFSDPEEPESYYTSEFGNWFSISDGHEGRVLSRIPAGLVYLTDHTAYLIRGRTPADFTLHELFPVSQGSYSAGCGAAGSAKETPHGLFFFDKADHTIFRISGDGQASIISVPIQKDLQDEIDDLSSDSDTRAHMNWWPKRNILFFSSAQSNGSMWAFDIEKGRWIGRATYSPMSMCQWNKANTGALSMIGMLSKSGIRDHVYQLFTGTDHGGTAISSPTIGSPTFTGSDPTIEKTFLYADLLMKGEASKSVTVNWFIDGATSADGTATVSLTGTDSRERHRIYINERGRELDVDVVLDNSSVSHGIYGIVYGYTEDTSVVQS